MVRKNDVTLDTDTPWNTQKTLAFGPCLRSTAYCIYRHSSFSPCHTVQLSSGRQPHQSQTGSQQSCPSQAAWRKLSAVFSDVSDTAAKILKILCYHTTLSFETHMQCNGIFHSILKLCSINFRIGNAMAYLNKKRGILTFIAKPDGIMFLGHSKSVEWMRVPDSTNSTALLSGLRKVNKSWIIWREENWNLEINKCCGIIICVCELYKSKLSNVCIKQLVERWKDNVEGIPTAVK